MVALAIGIFLASCSKKEVMRAPSVVNVKTMRVSPSSHVVGKSYMGKIEEQDGANVSFDVTGNVKRVYVEEGQFVKRGQVLAEVDGKNIRSAYEISAASLHQAEDAYRRLKDLYEKGTLPEIRMVEAETALASARASEAISRRRVEDIVLRAPFAGYVASNSIHEGASVMPGVSGFRLVKIDRVKVAISIPEKEIGRVRNGQKVILNVNALGDRRFDGTVVNRGVTADVISHAYTVKAVVDNHSHQLLPGMVCKVRLENNTEGTYAIVVPQQAIQISGQDKYVWLAKDGRSYRQNVLTGDILNDGVVIESGLSAGDMVIIEGQNNVSEGSEIKTE